MKPVRNLFWITILFVFSCTKESFTNNSSYLLQTSADTLHFDTVFTTTGSVTQVFMIRNENKEGIRISSLRLGGGASSFFRINVDGTPGPVVQDVPLGANDSLYVLVSVQIQPGAANLPFIVRDSLEISYNGNRKWVQLDAYGQNAHFLRNKKITGTETWNNDLPYVILDQLTVDTSATLVINKGCRIFFHADAPMIIHGTLQVNGEKWDSTRVVFRGDRLDVPYRDFPASYPGLIFTGSSRNNIINYALVKNAYQGIVVLDPSPGTKLTLNETIIDNAYDAGLMGINTSITARNLLVSNCGKNLVFAKGGNYDLTHCTVASYSNSYIQHKDPSLLLTNFINQNGVLVTAALTARFTNCIFWGENNGQVPDEVVLLKQGTDSPTVVFDQVLWRVETTPAGAAITGAINHQPPLFDSINTGERFYSFRLKDNSPALNKGKPTSITIDLDGAPRPVGLPDLGAYERQ